MLKPFFPNLIEHTDKVVVKHYRDLTRKEIKANLDKQRNDFALVALNFSKGVNVGTLIRTSNLFLSREIIVVGSKQFNTAAAVGTHHYENVWHAREWPEARDYLREKGYSLVGVECRRGGYDLRYFRHPEKPAFILGNECFGIPREILTECDYITWIPMWGAAKSLNVGTAGAIVMYDWILKNKQEEGHPAGQRS